MAKFELKMAARDEPFASDPFWAYLDEHADKRSKTKDIEHIKGYLVSLGFVVGEDEVDPDQLESLRVLVKCWYDFTPWYKPCGMDELFNGTGETYYLKNDAGFDSRVQPSIKLIGMTKEAGWIHRVCPETTYFEIINQTLFAKYQQILGSRRLCLITDLVGSD